MATANAVHVDECHSDRLAGITFENWGHISTSEFTRKREKVKIINHYVVLIYIYTIRKYSWCSIKCLFKSLGLTKI